MEYLVPLVQSDSGKLFTALSGKRGHIVNPKEDFDFRAIAFLHAVIFIVFAAIVTPIQHDKSDANQSGDLVWIPFVAVLLLCLVLSAIGNIPIVVKGIDATQRDSRIAKAPSRQEADESTK